ncbi:hypothetical protein [uncultured Nostoc sp.]|uniref:hypothetical protein n=1 Tax=uncultured Nostoc sp. TaxID=340711 RepID=UPI0035CC190F
MSAKADGTLRIAGYQILEQLYSGSRTQVYRAVRECDRLPVVIKLLKREYPTFSELVQFRNQYAIAKNLDISGIIKPYSLDLSQWLCPGNGGWWYFLAAIYSRKNTDFRAILTHCSATARHATPVTSTTRHSQRH